MIECNNVSEQSDIVPEPKTNLTSLGLDETPILGRLAHDLTAATSAARGRWVTIEVWEPDPDSDPRTHPEAEDVLTITGVGVSAFIVSGDYTDELRDQFPILIRNSTPNSDNQTNDGLYALDGDSSLAAGSTTIPIQGVLPDVTITDGELVIVRPTVLRDSGRKVCVVSRWSVAATAGTFVKATPTGFEWLIDVLNCTREEGE